MEKLLVGMSKKKKKKNNNFRPVFSAKCIAYFTASAEQSEKSVGTRMVRMGCLLLVKKC